MHNKQYPEDRFPYEQSFIQFKISEGMLPGTAEEYAGKLFIFFEGVKLSNPIFAATNRITVLSLDDLNSQFEKIKGLYSRRTFNSIHTCVNQYYRFLITEARLPVPPLTWSVSTNKLKQTPELLMLPWEALAKRVIESQLPEDHKLIFLLFSKGWSLPMMMAPYSSRKLLHFNWTEQERQFLHDYSYPLFNKEHLFVKSTGEPYHHNTINKHLRRVILELGLKQKHGALRDDARIMYIAHHNLDGTAIEKQYGFVLGGRFSSLLLRLAREVSRIEKEQEQL